MSAPETAVGAVNAAKAPLESNESAFQPHKTESLNRARGIDRLFSICRSIVETVPKCLSRLKLEVVGGQGAEFGRPKLQAPVDAADDEPTTWDARRQEIMRVRQGW